MNIDNRLTICVSSPDSYSDVFSIYYTCFMKFCKDCQYELILSTNTKQYDGITVLNNYKSNDSWTERMLLALEKARSKYILIMCDDTIITGNVDYSEIERILDDMDEYKLNFCGLLNRLYGKPLYKGSILVRIKNRKAYAKNLQCGIYNREYLINEIGDGNISAWDLEKKWLEETLNAPKGYSNDIVSCKKNILHCVHGVSKGKWYESAIEKLGEVGVQVNTSRAIIPKKRQRITKIYNRIGKAMTPKIRRGIKKILSSVGFKFVTKN